LLFINREAAVWNYTIDICVYNWAGPGVQRCLGMQEHAYYIAATCCDMELFSLI